MDSDVDSVNSGDQEDMMLKTTTDKICLNDNIDDSGGRSGKNRTKKSIYEDYTAIPTEVIPINLPFSTKDIISSFELNHGVEVAEDDVPLDLIKIPGKKVYFLQANSVLITKLKKQNKKYKKREDYTVMSLCSDKEEYVKRMLENVTFRIVSMFSQNTTNTTGSFQEALFHMIHLIFIITKLCCLCHYILDLHLILQRN